MLRLKASFLTIFAYRKYELQYCLS